MRPCIKKVQVGWILWTPEIVSKMALYQKPLVCQNFEWIQYKIVGNIRIFLNYLSLNFQCKEPFFYASMLNNHGHQIT